MIPNQHIAFDLADRHPEFRRNLVTRPSLGASSDSESIDQRLRNLVQFSPGAFVGLHPASTDLETTFFESRLRIKLLIANVAMHIKDAWRASLFRQLDDILDHDEWDSDDPLPRPDSVHTFLRLIIYLRFKKCPGLGFAHGDVVASWTDHDRRLTIECGRSDTVQWVLSHFPDGVQEITAGSTTVKRLPGVLAPYAPDEWLFAT